MLKFVLTDKSAGIMLLGCELMMLGLFHLTRDSIFQFAAGGFVGLLCARIYTRRAAPEGGKP